jgi:LmbE family N-acetylglucosaminyl deacetylase
MKLISCLLLCFLSVALVSAQSRSGPKVLVVTSHPDDETLFAVTLYKITHDLNGIVDLALMTDGAGGYGNTELASQYYRLNLRDSAVARAHLPAIRKRELMRAGEIMGIRNFFFFDQPDDLYGQDPAPYIGGTNWDIPAVEKKLDAILLRTAYDFVFILLPNAMQHGHHKSSGLLALRAVTRLPANRKPIVLGALEVNKEALPKTIFEELQSYPETRIRKGAPIFTFDRRYRFGNWGLVSYMVVHDWVVAEYKSQGDTQNNYINQGDLEAFWYFDLNGATGVAKAQKLFDDLKASGYPTK